MKEASYCPLLYHWAKRLNVMFVCVCVGGCLKVSSLMDVSKVINFIIVYQRRFHRIYQESVVVDGMGGFSSFSETFPYAMHLVGITPPPHTYQSHEKPFQPDQKDRDYQITEQILKRITTHLKILYGYEPHRFGTQPFSPLLLWSLCNFKW